MGHYDDCYAFDDFKKLTIQEKLECYQKFNDELDKDGVTWGYLDDVYGYILQEWGHLQGLNVETVNKVVTVRRR